MLKIPELLAPAGDMVSLNAAVCAGADAVYLGLEDFNARRGAGNFTLENLEEAGSYAHARGVKVYVTLNTLVITRELKKVLDLVERSISAGADAFIVQDIGLAYEIANVAGEEFLHVSTQMNIHNSDGIVAAKTLGASRVTLARELSLEEIEELSSLAHVLEMEVETFAHGAICVCYSGQCLMSSCIGARSANRGLCAQACRLPWELTSGSSGKNVAGKVGPHLLSPKDMCTVNNLEQLARAGVDSLKIEGRMKSPEYVFSVVKVYREVLDSLAKNEEAKATTRQMEVLKSSFSRGFTNGLLFGERGCDFMSYDRPNNRGLFAGRVKNKRIFSERKVELEIEAEAKISAGDTINIWTKHGGTVLKVPDNAAIKNSRIKFVVAENCKDVRVKDRVFRVKAKDDEFKFDLFEPRIPIDVSMKLKLSEPFEIKVKAQGISAAVRGEVVDEAKTKAVTKDEAISHFDRLGQTSFVLHKIDVDLDEGVGIGFSQIHKLRSSALDELFSQLTRVERKDLTFEARKCPKVKRQSVAKIGAMVTNADDARLANKAGCDVYVPALNHIMGQGATEGVVLQRNTQANYPKDVTIASPIVSHDEVGASREAKLGTSAKEQARSAKRVLCDDLASALAAKERGQAFEIGQFVPVTNDATITLINALEPDVVWLSCELNLKQIEDVASKLTCDVGLFIMGRQRLMTCEHCVLMSEGACSENCQSCKRRAVIHSLVDRKQIEFPVSSDALGRSTIYNSVSLDLTPNLGELLKCGVNHFMIDGTLMSSRELASAISRAREALRTPPKTRLTNSTSGHLFRGV